MSSIFEGLNYGGSLTAQINALKQTNPQAAGGTSAGESFDEILNSILYASKNNSNDLYSNIASLEAQISTLNNSNLPTDPKEFLMAIQQNYLNALDSFIQATGNDDDDNDEDQDYDILSNVFPIEAQLNMLKYQSGDLVGTMNPDEFLLYLQQNYAGLIDNFTSSGSNNDSFATWTDYQNSVNALNNQTL